MNRLPVAAMGLLMATLCLSGMSPAAAQEGGVEVLGTEVCVSIHNSYAVTEVTKRLSNTGASQAEHVCVFNVPDTAFVSNLTVEAGNGTFYAVAVGNDLAEAVYNYQVEVGATATIVSSRGVSVYCQRITLEPGEEATVRFRFEQMIPKQSGSYSYRMLPDADAGAADFAFAADIRYKDDIANVTADGLAGAAISHKRANWVSVAGTMAGEELPGEIFVNYTVAQPPPEGRMIFYEDNGTGYFMHIYSPCLDQVGGESIPKQIEFCLDKSGSMSGEKMDQLKAAFGCILPALDAEDRFGIVMFDEGVHEPVSSSIIQATEANTGSAADSVGLQVADGATNIGLAAETGLDRLEAQEVPNPIVVILTDGRPTAGIVEPQALREHIRASNTAEAKIFCLGFGPDVDYELLEAIALENGGRAVRIYTGVDAADQMVGFYDMISVTLVTGMDFEYSPGASLWQPRNRTALFKGSEVIVTGLYPKGQASLTAYVNGTTQQGAASYSREFDTDPDPDDEYVSRFWAYSRIMHLRDLITVQGESPELVNETVDLAVRFNFVTDYTSYVGGDALDEALDAINPTGPPQLYTHGGADADDGPVGSTPAPGPLSMLMLAVSLAMLAGWAVRRRR